MPENAAARAYELVNEAIRVIHAAMVDEPIEKWDEAETEAMILAGTLRRLCDGK